MKSLLNKNKVKIKFTIQLIQLREIPTDFVGSQLQVEAKRGKKSSNTQKSKVFKASEITTDLSETLVWDVSFLKPKKEGEKVHPKKDIVFEVHEATPKGKSLGKAVLNLNEYSDPGTIRTEILPLSKEKKPKSLSNLPRLGVKISTQWLKIDDKKLVKKSPDAPTTGPTVNLGGEHYALEQADEVTASTQASLSDDEEHKEDFPQDEEEKQGAKSSENGHDASINLEILQGQIGDLKKDNDRLEKRVQKLLKEKEDLMKEKAVQTSDDTKKELENAELEDLRRDKARLEKKVAKLTSELEEAKQTTKVLEKKKKKSGVSEKIEKELEDEAKRNATEISTLRLQLLKDKEVYVGMLQTIIKLATNVKDETSLFYWFSVLCSLFRVTKTHVAPEELAKPELVSAAEPSEEWGNSTLFLFEIQSAARALYAPLVNNAYALTKEHLGNYFSQPKKMSAEQQAGPIATFLKNLGSFQLPDAVAKFLMEDLMSMIDSILFNDLIDHQHLFTCSKGFEMKMGLSNISSLLTKSHPLAHQFDLFRTKEAINLLVMDKSLVSDPATRKEIFSHLNLLQVKHIVRNFKPDELAPAPVASEITYSLEQESMQTKDPSATLLIDFQTKSNLSLVALT